MKASSGSMPWPPAEAPLDVELTRAFTSCLPGGRIAGPLRAYRSLTSTQTVARAWSAEGAPEGAVVLADHQTEGRGRQGRRWTAPPGTALLFSVILHPALPLARWPEIPLAAGCAVAEGLEAVAPVSAKLKWPNDVLVDGSKLAGILAEGAAGDRAARRPRRWRERVPARRGLAHRPCRPGAVPGRPWPDRLARGAPDGHPRPTGRLVRRAPRRASSPCGTPGGSAVCSGSACPLAEGEGTSVDLGPGGELVVQRADGRHERLVAPADDRHDRARARVP